MIRILLDPWVAETSSASDYKVQSIRGDFLRQVKDLKGSYSLEVVPFLTSEELNQILLNIKTFFRPADRKLLPLIQALRVKHATPQAEQAVLSNECSVQPSVQWLKALARCGKTDTPPRWRCPAVVVPDCRAAEWPRQISYDPGPGSGEKTRSVVVIDRADQHEFFLCDLDPWRLGCSGEPVPEARTDERRNSCRRLPRPYEEIPLSTPFPKLAEVTKRVTYVDPSSQDWNYCPYLPPVSWDPCVRSKDDWRTTSFPKDGITSSGVRGYLDRGGYVWVWDRGEAYHWDVIRNRTSQRVARVQYDGQRLRS